MSTPTRAIEINARPLALIFVLVLLAAACAWSVWLQKNLMDKITSMEADIQYQDTQFERIVAIEAAITEQRDILHTALGHVLPVKMPSDWEERLIALEDEASNPESWPTELEQSEEFVNRFAELISELSPLAEANYFPRLAPLRWAAVAFEAMHRKPGIEEALFNLAEQLRAIADAKPAGMDSNLDQLLRERAEERETQAEEQSIDEMLEQARRYLSNPETGQHDSVAPDATINEIYDTLGLYEDHPERKDEIYDVRAKLGHQILIREAREQVNDLSKRWTNAKKLAVDSAPVYETAANMLMSEVTVARITAVLQGFDTSVYDHLSLEIQGAVDENQNKVRRGYQEWALRQIMDFEGTRKEIEDRPREAYDNEDDEGFCQYLPRLICGNWTEEKNREIQEAMISYLLPIDQALLELPVLNRYQREFNAGWERLEEHRAQTCVAIASAAIKNRTMHNFGAHDPDAESAERSELWEREECEQ